MWTHRQSDWYSLNTWINLHSYSLFLLPPPFDTPLEFRWRKTRVDITLPEALRENTTYILTLDTNLRDNNRVALKQPITLAFATGPVINRGQIKGRLVNNQDGKGISNFDIYAYAIADSTAPTVLPESPDYRTQTGENGAFNFDYMSEQPYFVIALKDGNRNRMPDANEAFAVPPTEAIYADTAATELSTPWLVTATDTVQPAIQRVRALSTNRILVRFSESVQLLSRSLSDWTLRDSLSNETIPITDIFLLPEDPRQIFLLTPPLSSSTHFLSPANIADSSGNPVSTDSILFAPSTSPDTLQTRFSGFAPERNPRDAAGALILRPSQFPTLRLNQAVEADSITAYVTLSDSTGTTLPFSVFSENGSSFLLSPEEPFPRDHPLTVSLSGNLVNLPDTSFTELFSFPSSSNFGEISGVIVHEDSAGQSVVELIPADITEPNASVQRILPGSDGSFQFSNLPDKARYRLRAFLDINQNETWDGGQVVPYQRAESIIWPTDSLQVRARWEQSLPDTLRIPIQ